MLGIDVSKKTLVCTLLASEKQTVLWRNEFANPEAGIAQLLAKTPSDTPWVIEPTGRYSLGAVKGGREAGRDVRLAPTRQAKAFLQSLPQRAKTDKLDSYGLAVFGLSRVLPVYPVKEAWVETLDQLLSARKALARSLAKLRLQESELPEAAPYLLPCLAPMQEQIKALDQKIKTLVRETPDFEAAVRLQRVPGIGSVTSAAITSRLSAKSFAHPDQFVAYCGLDLRVHDSGESRESDG